MNDLAEFLAWYRAQLDEDEEVAQAATSAPWVAKRADRSVYAQETAVVMGGHDGGWYVVGADFESGEGIEPKDAVHIARHDPARVLREVDAKRRVLDLHPPRALDRWQVCATCRPVVPEYPQDSTTELWPCPTLRALALPYSDRPGYREEWRLR